MSVHTRTTKNLFLRIWTWNIFKGGPQAIVMICACDTSFDVSFFALNSNFRSYLFYFPCSTTIRIIIIFRQKSLINEKANKVLDVFSFEEIFCVKWDWFFFFSFGQMIHCSLALLLWSPVIMGNWCYTFIMTFKHDKQ